MAAILTATGKANKRKRCITGNLLGFICGHTWAHRTYPFRFQLSRGDLDADDSRQHGRSYTTATRPPTRKRTQTLAARFRARGAVLSVNASVYYDDLNAE